MILGYIIGVVMDGRGGGLTPIKNPAAPEVFPNLTS